MGSTYARECIQDHFRITNVSDRRRDNRHTSPNGVTVYFQRKHPMAFLILQKHRAMSPLHTELQALLPLERADQVLSERL